MASVSFKINDQALDDIEGFDKAKGPGRFYVRYVSNERGMMGLYDITKEGNYYVFTPVNNPPLQTQVHPQVHPQVQGGGRRRNRRATKQARRNRRYSRRKTQRLRKI
jgi:hypothetical protein